MSALLGQAIAQARQLPDAEQQAIATILLAEIAARLPSVVAEPPHPLRGTVLRYDDPIEPVAECDWKALQ